MAENDFKKMEVNTNPDVARKMKISKANLGFVSKTININ